MWPTGEFPHVPVGKLVLNRNPVDYFAQVEQIAFAPAHMVPGVEPSPDRMLQVGRFNIYITADLAFQFHYISDTGSAFFISGHSTTPSRCQFHPIARQLSIPCSELPTRWADDLQDGLRRISQLFPK